MKHRARLINYFSRHDRGWVLGLCALVGAIYLPFLGSQFFFDDLSFFSTDTVEVYKSNSFDFGLRWLPYASLGRLYAIFSSEFSYIYRLCNMLLHAANAVLLFYFLRNLVAAVQAYEIEPARAVRGAWFGASVFALHPVAAFAVGYVIQISVLMSTLFSLLMLLAYLHGLLSGERRWFALAVLAYFLACFSKEHSVLMPAVLWAMGLLLSSGKRVDRHVLWLTWLALIAIALFVTLRAHGVLGSPYEPMAKQLFAQQGIEESTPVLHLLSALTQAGLFFKYLLLWILPDPTLMSIDMRETFLAAATSWQAWLGGIAFMLYGMFGIRLLLRGGTSGLFGFAMLYPWLLFWVEMAGIRMQEPFVLYRSYLWMPGMALFIPIVLAKLPEQRGRLIMVCLLLLFIPLSWARLWIFSDSYRLWNEAAILLKDEQVAGADRIYFNRGQAEMAEKKWEAAAADFKRASDISPELEPIHYLLGAAYGNAGRFAEALTQFDTAISLQPDDSQVYFSKGMTLKLLHRDEESMLQMEQSCKLNNKVACLILKVQHRGRNSMGENQGDGSTN
ncbi:hypothetical protein MIZ01_0428 [Sideroxyarcus emersonii]|uniref:Uncharacterized protein n=1 Tax=Sideroxyarcus emersonii TaxID=2764705 RepID=A0AAN2BYE7_9PROT|nr:tetratricopeptide repeat protein [Sideroxyarcus emersonii]BCK86662.1 hypothetical protein MIZ01_0428 [Sideroxyarcus emersonii]